MWDRYGYRRRYVARGFTVTPADIAKSGTESGHQRALFARVNEDLWQLEQQRDWGPQWDGTDRRWAAPLRWLHAIPNGGSRGDDARSRAIRGATMKAEGVKEGVPDLFLPYPRGPYAGFYIEMKRPGGKASKEQLEFAEYAKNVHYKWELCDTWEKAYTALVDYLTK